MPLGPSQPIHAILWDLDGVLVDTGEIHYLAWERTLAEFDIPFNRQLFLQTFGMNNTSVLTILFGHPLKPEFIVQVSENKELNFRAAIHGHARLFPGVLSCLEHCQAMDYRQAIASSAPQENIEVLVDELNLRRFFTALVSARDLPGKPDPAVFLEAARRLKVPPEQCLVIEDSLPGLEAAHRAGMCCIAITNTNPPEVLAEADLVLRSLLDIPKLTSLQ